MPAYYHGPMMHHFRRGPRRFVWFILGGLAATWWMKHKEMRTHERYMGYCLRKPMQSAPANHNPDNTTKMGGAANPNEGRSSALPPSTPVVWGDKEWEEEKVKMWAMGQQAGDTVSDFSEAALENVLSAVETLKAKLAEHRAQRERQRQPLYQHQHQQPGAAEEPLKKDPTQDV